jgi:5-methyltetrahydrofolate--homocysteine methyltransferase
VVDLGVMVPAQKILDAAREHNADIIGLSGLITPSLEEMSHVAREMQRQGFDLPLLIGGATTSRAHTALKIDPHYKAPTVWVKDASRAVGVAQSLISRDLREAFVAANEADYAEIRARHRNRGDAKRLVTLEHARAEVPGDWDTTRRRHRTSPACTCSTTTRWPNWSTTSTGRRSSRPGSWPASSRPSSPTRSSAPRPASCTGCPRDARPHRRREVADRQGRVRPVAGQQRRRRRARAAPRAKPPALPAPAGRQAGRAPDFCLADFIAPPTAQAGLDRRVRGHRRHRHRRARARFEAEHDDYNAILLKALADRFAEALAERLHQRVRTEFWGYERAETLDNDALIDEQYRGIRPAPGYPACPEHSEKRRLFDLLQAEANAGMELTESFAMLPTAAVSGYYFSHPQSQYFVVGRLSREQVSDYARRKGVDRAQAERWLASNLDYDPNDKKGTEGLSRLCIAT